VLSYLVKVSYFAGVHMDRIEDPDVVQSNGWQVASLIDLTGTTLKQYSNTPKQRIIRFGRCFGRCCHAGEMGWRQQRPFMARYSTQ
jgi:hypothetical protein